MSKTEKKTVKRYGWHWLPADRKLKYNDGRLVKTGELLVAHNEVGREIAYPVMCCQPGMHAAKTKFAKNFANNGNVLCLVEVFGPFANSYNKFAGVSRRVLASHAFTEDEMDEIKAYRTAKMIRWMGIMERRVGVKVP